MALAKPGGGQSSEPGEFQGDGLSYTIQICPNISIRESNDMNAAAVQKAGTRRVAASPARMLVAIEFNSEANGSTVEVQDKGADRVLPTERRTELCSAKKIPKSLLYWRHRAPQIPCAAGHGRRSAEARVHRCDPHPDPPPFRGRAFQLLGASITVKPLPLRVSGDAGRSVVTSTVPGLMRSLITSIT